MSVNKVCIKCNVEKDICCFHKNVTYTSGYESTCKECRKIENRSRSASRRAERLKEEISYKNKEVATRSKSMDGEDWRDIPFIENYQASNLGRIRAKNRLSEDGRLLQSSIKKPSVHTSGYLRYTLTIDGKHKSFYGHTLVSSAFLGEKPDGYDVDHIDKCKINNNISNLRYIKIKENRGHLFNKNAMKL